MTKLGENPCIVVVVQNTNPNESIDCFAKRVKVVILKWGGQNQTAKGL